MALHAESGVEIEPLDMYSLILHDSGGEQRVESSGDQRNSLALLSHHKSVVGTVSWGIIRK